MSNNKESQPSTFDVLEYEWKELIERIHDGIHWPVKNPHGQEGITVKYGKSFFELYPIIDHGDLQDALCDAHLLYEILSNLKVLREVPGERANYISFLRRKLLEYRKPKGERETII